MGFINRVGLIVGIDPDIEKNGVAILDKNRRTLSVFSLNFPETLERIKDIYIDARKEHGEEYPFMVYVEAGWLNKGNWHVTESRNGKFSPAAWAAAVGKSDGECSAVSKKLIECFEYYEIPVTAQKPLRKCWKGPNRKITHDELLRELKLYRIEHAIKRTNPETRDASLIAIAHL